MKTETSTIVQLATCYLNLKKYQDAEDILKKHTNNGNSPELYYYLGLTYAAQAKFDDAINSLTFHLSNSNDSKSSRELVFKLLIKQAQTALGNSNYSALSDIIDKAIKFSPNDADSAKILSHFESVLPVSFLRNGEREKAAAFWTDKLKQNSFSNPETIHNLALLYYWWAVSNEQEILDEQDYITNQKRELADYLWSRTFMYWFSFINSKDYWEKFCNSRSYAWKSDVSLEIVSNLKSEISKKNLLKVLEDFQDKYRQKGANADFARLQACIINYFFEKKTANYWTEFYELITNNYKAFDSDLQKKVDEILLFNGPYTLNFLNEHFPIRFRIKDVLNGLIQIKKSEKDNEVCENIRIFYTFPIYGKILIAIRETKDIEYAGTLWESLDENSSKQKKKSDKSENAELINSLSLPHLLTHLGQEGPILNKESAEAMLLSGLIHFEKGNSCLHKLGVKDAFIEWDNANKIIKKAIELDKSKNCKSLLSELQTNLLKTASDECVKYAKKLNAANKIDEAIEILETGFNMTKNELIRNLMCANYCDKAQSFSKDKNWNKANEFYNKALKIDKNYLSAIKGMATSKHNEGMANYNNGYLDTAITLFEEANNLEKDDLTEEFLARTYNQKAVNIINGLSSYSSHFSYDPAIALLKKALKLQNPKLDVNSLATEFEYYEEFMFNSKVRNLEDDIYKTMLRNFWVAVRSKHNLRGY